MMKTRAREVTLSFEDNIYDGGIGHCDQCESRICGETVVYVLKGKYITTRICNTCYKEILKMLEDSARYFAGMDQITVDAPYIGTRAVTWNSIETYNPMDYYLRTD